MKIAYLDVTGGASGDMLLGALAHAGRRVGRPVDEAIAAAVASLGAGCAVTFQRVVRGGIEGLRAAVHTPPDPLGPDRLRRLLEEAALGEVARSRALAALQALLDAEAHVHGTGPSETHLHELGSADTVADLAGVVAGLEALGVEAVTCSPVPAPRGWVETEGGILPLPSPAALELLRGAVLFGVDDPVELVTPTAAALLVTLAAGFGPLPPMTLETVGVGAGARERARPNVCRVLVGSAAAASPEADAAPASVPPGVRLGRVVVLETNIDDQSPEALGHALQAIFAAGALDAWVAPVTMKKSRPGFQLSVLCDPSAEGRVVEAVLRETTTFGIRRRETARWTLGRTELHVPVRGTNVRVQVGRIGEEVVTVSPEHEDCATVVRRTGLPLWEVVAEATEKARRMLTRRPPEGGAEAPDPERAGG